MGKAKQAGFTMIELSIVVAIIGLLAALAIPDFMKMVSKSRQSEAKVLLGAIASAELQHKVKGGGFVSCPLNPPKPGGMWENMPEWNEIGFGAQGELLYQYEVKVTDKDFVVYARANIDTDPTIDEWEIKSEDLFLKNTINDVH